MIIQILEKIIQQKNPDFKLDQAITTRVIMSMAWTKAWARLRAFRLLFYGKWPSKVFIGKGVQFFNVANMQFGKWVQLEDHVYLSALGKGKLMLGNNVKIGAYSRLIIATSFNNLGAHITIGDNVGLGEFAYLGGAGGLEIGANCIIGQYLSCHPENHIFEDTSTLIRLQATTRKGISVGQNCWIGAKVTILDGVTIGDNCVIAAGAVVTKNMPANSVIGGVPAKILKSISSKTSQAELRPV